MLDCLQDLELTPSSEVRSFLSEQTGSAAASGRYMFSTVEDVGIHTAAQTGELARLEDILANGESDVDELDGEGATPLMMAAIGGHKKLVVWNIYNHGMMGEEVDTSARPIEQDLPAANTFEE